MPARPLGPHLARALLASALIAAGCKETPLEAKAEIRLASDLPAQTVDIILKSVHQRGGPLAERIPGLGLGASALAAEGSRNVHSPADAGATTSAASRDGEIHAAADAGEPGPPEPP